MSTKRFDFSKFAHLDTDAALERDGVDVPIRDSGIVLTVRRAGGRNFGFEKHRDDVVKGWKKTHGTKPLVAEDLRAFNRDVFAHCIAAWNEDIVGVPFTADAARELIDLEAVYETVVRVSTEMEHYLRAKVLDAKEFAGNGSSGSFGSQTVN